MTLKALSVEGMGFSGAPAKDHYAHLCLLSIIQLSSFKSGLYQEFLLVSQLVDGSTCKGIREELTHADGARVETFVLALWDLALPLDKLIE